MLKVLVRRLGVVLGSLVLAAGMLYAVSPWILSAAGSAWLERLGAYAVTVDAGYPRWGSLRIETVRARRTSGAARYGVAAVDVTLRYRPAEVLRGRLSGVHVARADVSVDSGDPLEARDLAALFAMPGGWIRALALETGAVELLSVRFGGRGEVFAEAQLSGEIAVVGEHLRAGFDVALGQSPAQHVAAELGADGRMSLTVRARDAADVSPWLSVDSARSGDQAIAVSGRVDTQASAAAAALAPLLPADSWDAVTGRVSGDWALVLPTDPDDWSALLLSVRGNARLEGDLEAGGALLRGEVSLSAGTQAFSSTGELLMSPAVLERILTPLGVRTPWPPGIDGSVSVSWESSVPNTGAREWSAVRDRIGLQADFTAAVGETTAPARVQGESRITLAAGRADSSGTLRGDAAALAPFLAHWWTGSGAAPAPAGSVELRWAATAPLSAPEHPDGWLRVLALDAAVSGEVQVDGVGGAARDLSASGSITAVLRGGRLRLSAAPGLRLTAAPGLIPWLAAHGVNEAVTLVAADSLALELSVHARRYRLKVPGGSAIELQRVVLSDVGAPVVRVRLIEDTELTRAGAGQWAYDAVALAVNAPAVLANLEALGPIENVAGDVLFTAAVGRTAPSVTLRDVSLDALGGRLAAQRIELDAAGGPSTVELDVSGIELARVVRLEQQPGLQASGRIDGSLTLLVDADGTVSGTGRFTGRAPGGVIRYEPGESARRMVDANPGLKFTHDALGNLHYEVLLADARYARDGQLVLQVRIEGVNPDWKQDQPIRLNLNLEENVPKLLESLRLSDDFSRVIEQRVEELYRNRKGGA